MNKTLEGKRKCKWFTGCETFRVISVEQYKYKGKQYEVDRFIGILQCVNCGDITFRQNIDMG